MKTISALLLLTSFAALADETCKTSLYNFKITKSYIEARGQGEHVKLPYSEVRSLSYRSRNDFNNLIFTLSNEIYTDEALTRSEAASIERFSLTMADGNEALIGMMYAKGYDKKGQIVVRYMITEDRSFRCQ